MPTRSHCGLFPGLMLLFVSAFALPALAADGPLIAIIIDDLGHRQREGLRAVSLPAQVTCAVLPHTPHGKRLAHAAEENGKEVMLHLPLQSLDKTQHSMLGPGAIWLDTTRGQFATTLGDALDAVPHARGVNNHQGSLLTQHPGHMAWLMEELTARDNLYFVDSVTTEASVAARLAGEHGLPHLSRDIFLDSDPDAAAITEQLQRLLDHAQRYGHAVGIGHPYPSTMDVLEKSLPALHQRGYRFVTVSVLLRTLAQRRATALPAGPSTATP